MALNGQSVALPLFLLLLLHATVNLADDQSSQKLTEIEMNVLASIKASLTDLPSSTFFSTWDLTDPDPCSTFTGLTCDDELSRVTILELGTGLSGTLGLAGVLPDEITQLTELTQLILNPGLVTGPIPDQLGQMKSLRVLFLSHNRLTGPIPGSVVELTQLHTLDLSFNRLTGSIPPGLLKSPNLKVLVLAGNQLTGQLPASASDSNPDSDSGSCSDSGSGSDLGLGLGSGLFHLDVKCNRLVGPIPTTLPLTLRYVSLSQNLMWGPINGTIFEQLPDLSYVDLSYNQFRGPVPTVFFRPSLSNLLLNHNNLTGPLTPSEPGPGPGPYPAGSTVDLSHNGLSGGLPAAVAGAENIFLNNNRFSGPVPEVYAVGVKSGKIKTLYLQHNFLDKFPKGPGPGLGPGLPDNAEVCLAYNCMVPPLGLDSCPSSAGGLGSRPATQCPVFHNG